MSRKISISILIMFATIVISLDLQAGQREDYLECELSNGDKFILINKYDYSPMAKFIPHAASRINQFGFEAYYKSKNGKLFPDSVERPRSFDPYMMDSELERKKVCSLFSNRNGYIRAGGYVVSIEDGKVLNTKPIYPDNDYFDEIIKSEVDRNLYPLGFGSDLKEHDRIVVEKILISEARRNWESPITAVIQTQSTDNGQTWSAPIITKDAKLFEIGKSILDQPAVAKPGKWKKGPG